MKRLLSFMLCASVFFVFGCNTTPDPVLSVNPENLAFTAEGGSQTVQVKANNPWTASASGSGISVNPSSGNGDATVTINALPTNSTDPISGAVSFRSEGLFSTVSITQEERKVIQLGDVMIIPAEGGTFAVDMQYNTDVVVEVESAAQSWITFVAVRALKSGKLEFQFAENGSTDPRQGKITVKDKNGKVSPITLNFVQEEKKVIAVGDVMEIPAEGGTFSVDVQYNTDVVVEVESAAQSWISFVAVRALKSGKLEFQFAENPDPDVRTGKVTVKDKNGKVSPIALTFAQAEKKVIAVGDVMTIPAEGGTFIVDVQYNTDVVVEVESAAQSWITFVAVRALQSGKLEFRFAENSSTDPRQGKVTVKDKNGKVSPITLTFIQADKKVITVGEVMEIPAEGGTFSVDVQYNTDVVVEVESAAQSWIHFVAVRALTSGKLEFSFDANPNPDVRTGKVTVKDKNGKVKPITLTFIQADKKVIAVGDVMEIPAEGGTFSVDVQYNTNVVVEVESAAQSWIHFVAVRALTSGKLEFIFEANPNPDVRSGKVTVKDKNGKVAPTTLIFTQAEKKVIAVGDVMEIPAEGGTFAIDVQYNTDVVVEVESAARSWIHFVTVRALTSGKLEFSFDANPNPDIRNGKVTVKDRNGKVAPTTLTFTQAEKKVINVGDVMEIPAEGGTFEIDVQYNTDVVVEIESAAQSWIHFVAVRALTSGKLEFSFDANPNPDIRTGKVTVKDKNGKVSPITLSFVQEEKMVIDVGSTTTIQAEGGSYIIGISYNTDVVVEVEPSAQSWIDFIAVRALTIGELEFKFTENPSTTPREGKVTIKDKNGKVEPVILTFVQEGNSPFIDFKDPEVKAICIQLWDRSGNGELSEKEAAAVTDLGYGRFSNKEIHSFDELRFFTGIKTIPAHCFQDCSQLESITLPAQLESFGYGAFSGCCSLSGTLILSDKIKTIEDFAFSNCGFTGSLTLPESLEKLGYGAFQECTGFSGDLTIPRNTKTILGQCFLYCSGFNGELTIPETVNSIGYLAFSHTAFSKARIISRTPAECNNYAFEHSDYLIYVPSGTAKIYQETPGWIEYRGRITEEGHDPSEFFYASTDYSRDGEVVCLQQATQGKGIDLIFMGDGFVDKDMEPGGKYETLMRSWMEKLFIYEPYKSFREWFSVYAVKVVSKHDVFNCPSSERKLTRDDGNGSFGNTISTLYSIANEYAAKATSGPKRITVFMNTEEKSVGRSYCSYSSSGYFNAWVFDNIERRPSTLVHESGGHGFGWLGDEYSEFNSTFTNQESLDNSHNWGYAHNLDWRNDPETVYWSHFLKDSRYSKEGLGVFEGGMRYSYGIYRPTMNSMMRLDYEKGAVFNAPGREAIYKRIMQWGIGEDWEYDYETFVAADEAGRKQAADAYAQYPPTRSYVQRDDMEPGLPPIMIDESVKELRITKDGKITLIR